MKFSLDKTFSDRETYELIAKAIAFMRQNHCQQPDLETIAQQVNLSKYHFQRLFTQWAGISPKRFSQYLTVEYAKAQIAKTKNILELTLDAGLSSPGRLHDLFVNLEAMSPGEFKTKGKGLQIRYGIHDTPFGICLIAKTTRGICNLHFYDSVDETVAENCLLGEWTNAELIYDSQATKETIDRIFQPTEVEGSALILHVKGTNFQIQVWRALLKIPLGSIATYRGLATLINRPNAARAVGNAIGKNPVGYLIPCHRVIRESGEMGGYRWGTERKSALLAWEASQNKSLK
ncbi:methylated-DNA--[protein]-cysteine S-methyltransferase [Myxosarcina sp. GI1]|uniref:methylated-DNA--[protein]-cysteine S-methyltransferase n=1 Tax=Myxosarcina sp. GI1 TaxID=1541065 RepID=UPI00055C2137|nr:methylated-DNA--[protein]-cysteine S-methyltransferase [Myxosarcina sp. GI1]